MLGAANRYIIGFVAPSATGNINEAESLVNRTFDPNLLTPEKTLFASVLAILLPSLASGTIPVPRLAAFNPVNPT
ncbi:MAG TPA: hypothetical protein PKA27_14770, partial [Fimbriimonadaceae bacterium]|nr:hypothetical protein [Fimbriimonadaceae bacterium]